MKYEDVLLAYKLVPPKADLCLKLGLDRVWGFIDFSKL